MAVTHPAGGLTHFADRLAALHEERRSRVVLGLDPDPAALWPGAADVRDHCLRAIEAAGPACVAVKLQLACFERLGPEGWATLYDVAGDGREAGLLVIADGKRGDVPVTAAVYAESLMRLGADAFTVNPLLGRDSLEPFVEAATAASAGCFVLVRTSNPGAADVQDVEAGGAPLWERLARMVDELGQAGESGLDHVGAVTGATRPEHLVRLRELMPRAIFLLPGVGAQGGRVEDLAPAFAPHPAAGLVTASRSIVNAHLQRGGDPAVAAAAAAEELRAAAAKL
jgi:orotidine-5'-phosphate decarboxylase